MLDVDVELERPADAVAQGDFDSAEVIGVQLNPYTTIAREAIQVALVGNLGDHFGRADVGRDHSRGVGGRRAHGRRNGGRRRTLLRCAFGDRGGVLGGWLTASVSTR